MQHTISRFCCDIHNMIGIIVSEAETRRAIVLIPLRNVVKKFDPPTS